jgi:glycerophosphoryl diester phosphodiesterase
MSDASTWPYPRWIAHRGAGQRAPENTLAAFKLGASLGYRMFECDVQVSLDGLPFLLHDDTLERTTNGSGLACEKTWTQLRALDAGTWHSPAFAGESIPSLDEVGRWCRERGLLLNLEIKPSLGQEERCGRLIAQAVARDWAAQAVWPLLSSFQPEALQSARQAAAHIPRALLLDRIAADSLHTAQALQCVAVVIEESLWTPDLAQAVHAQGLTAMSYTVNDPGSALRLEQIGVVGLISDRLTSSTPFAA